MAARPPALAAVLLAGSAAAGCVSTGGPLDPATEKQIHELIASFEKVRGTEYEENVRTLGVVLRDYSIPFLIEGLGGDPAPQVRMGCALALADTQRTDAIEPLAGAASSDAEPAVRYTSAYCLCRFRDPRGLPVLFEALRSENPTTRAIAIFRLKELTETDHGFVATDPPADRGAAVERWEVWYRDLGPEGAASKLLPPR